MLPPLDLLLPRPREYSAERPTEEEILRCGFFRVEFTGGSSSELCGVCSEDLRAEDFGMSGVLEDTATVHYACALWCTCLFVMHWGLPCRHMLAVWHREGRSTIPDGVVHARWLLADADKEIRRLVTHRSRAISRSAPRAAGASMSAGERAFDLAADCKLIVEVGSMTPALYTATKSRIQDVLFGLKSCTLTSGDTRGARAQAAAARAQGPPEDRAPLPAAHNPSQKTTEKGGARKRGFPERAQDSARAKAAKPNGAKATGKRPAASGTNAETVPKRAK